MGVCKIYSGGQVDEKDNNNILSNCSMNALSRKILRKIKLLRLRNEESLFLVKGNRAFVVLLKSKQRRR